MLEIHPAANLFPLMTDEEYQNLKNDIAQHGQREPIMIWQGKIIDGRNRYRACTDLGLNPVIREWDGSGDVVQYVLSLNLHRRHLDASQRALVAARVANLNNGQRPTSANLQSTAITQAQAAEQLNVSPRSVASAKTMLTNGIPELVAEVERGDLAVSRAAQIARLPEDEQREIISRPHVSRNSEVVESNTPEDDLKDAFVDGEEKQEYRHVSDDSYEWYTPADHVEAARELMGGIDLDPASCIEAQANVKASVYYTKETDGLAQKWTGRVWMNPPYCMPEIDKFTGRIIEEYKAGKVAQAVVLTNNSTDTAWFHRLLEQSDLVCLTRGRVKFWGPNGSAATGARQGQAIFYLGDNPDGFRQHFGKFGAIVKTCDN